MSHLLKQLTVASSALALWFAPVALAQTSDPSRVLKELKGFDFSRLAPGAQRELASVLTDEFDACGRPLTLLASLKKGDACAHTKRMVGLAAGLASEGSGASEISVQLARYNQSFLKPRAALKVDERTCTGKSDAKVTLVEFSDFECPVCGAVRPLLERFVAEHSAARLCWSPFPLEQHRHSTLCAQAALFARDGGKFWRVHDALFERQAEISPQRVRQVLQEAGLDLKAIDKAVAADRYLDELNASKELGKASGVDGTPSLYVNGRRHALGFAPETLLTSVDDELDWLAASGTWSSN